jgi:DNA-directed RNA polymerase specialized sigma24 family protein
VGDHPWERLSPRCVYPLAGEGFGGVASRKVSTGILSKAAPEGLGYEERSALWRAIQQLPPMQRRAVRLRHWLGLSVRETADELGVTEGTVKSHPSRGLAALEMALLATDR